MFTPSPKFNAVSESTATFCSPSLCSMRSIHWYPSHLQYVKGCEDCKRRTGSENGRPAAAAGRASACIDQRVRIGPPTSTARRRARSPATRG